MIFLMVLALRMKVLVDLKGWMRYDMCWGRRLPSIVKSLSKLCEDHSNAYLQYYIL